MSIPHPPLDPRLFTNDQLDIISLLESLGVVFKYYYDSNCGPYVSLQDRNGITMVMHFTNGKKHNTTFHSFIGATFQECMRGFVEHLGNQTPPWSNIDLCKDAYIIDFLLPPYNSLKELKMKLQLREASETTQNDTTIPEPTPTPSDTSGPTYTHMLKNDDLEFTGHLKEPK